ncbi:MAG: TolC family protein [Candidatus Eisenbacteria bacterium]|nr:TolC family protein [Candidatus Eisenbacteria bacterium]
MNTSHRFVSSFCALLAYAALTGPARAQAPADTLDLDTCIRIALQRQPSLRSAEASYDAARARAGQALSGALPRLSADADVSRSGAGVAGGGESGATSYSSGFSLRQRVFDLGVTTGSIRAARSNANAAEENARAARLDVSQTVAETYFGLLKTRRLVEVARAARDAQEAHFKQARAFFTVGTRPKYDVTKAEADLTSAELDLIKARNDERLAAVALAHALGFEEGTPPPIRDVQAEDIAEADARASLDEAERGRPDLRAAQQRLRAAGAQASSARGGLFPAVDGSLTYGWRSGDSWFSNTTRSWSVGLSASMPVFDGLLTVRRAQEAKASERTSEADYASLRLRAREDVERAVINLNVARENLGVARKLLAQAEENFNVAEGRYRAGTGSIIEVTDAQSLLTRARTQDVQARYDLQIARSTWLRALGRDR